MTAHCFPRSSEAKSSRSSKCDSSTVTSKRRLKDRQSEFFSALSGATNLTLVALREAASFAPIPYIGIAAGLAVDIWDAVQTTRSNKDSLQALGSDAISLVYAVIATCDEVLKRNQQKDSDSAAEQLKASDEEDLSKKDALEFEMNEGKNKEHSSKESNEAEKLSPELRRNLEHLCSTLTDIAKFTKHVSSRNSFVRFLTASSDAGKVTDFQNKMKMALDLFTLQSNITLRQVTSRIETQQAQLLTSLQYSTSLASPTSGGVNSINAASSAPGLIAASPASAEVPALDNVPTSVKHSATGQVPHKLPGDATDSAGGAGAAYAAFPAIFSFAGATFHTGDTRTVHNTAPREDRKRKEAETTTHSALASSETPQNEVGHAANTPAIEGNPGTSSGAITFTSIAGDQNTTWVNDQSRRWNYGNVYSPSESLRSGNSNTGRFSSTRRDLGDYDENRRQFGDEENEAEDEEGSGSVGKPMKNPFAALQPRGSWVTYGNHDWDDGYGAMYDQHRTGNVPHQTYYDENGIPTAAPRGRGRRGRRRRDEREYWD